MAVEDVEAQEGPVSEAVMWGAAAKVIGIAFNPQMTQSLAASANLTSILETVSTYNE